MCGRRKIVQNVSNRWHGSYMFIRNPLEEGANVYTNENIRHACDSLQLLCNCPIHGFPQKDIRQFVWAFPNFANLILLKMCYTVKCSTLWVGCLYTEAEELSLPWKYKITMACLQTPQFSRVSPR